MYSKEKTREAFKRTWSRLKDKVFERLGGKCVKCGFSDYRALQIDHINGMGSTNRIYVGNYTYANKYKNRYKWMKSLLEISEKELFSTYQLLCANCNWIKRSENKEAKGNPHKN